MQQKAAFYIPQLLWCVWFFCYIALTLHVNNNDLPNHLPCEKAEISSVAYLVLCSVMSGSLYWATHRQQAQRNGKLNNNKPHFLFHNSPQIRL